MVDLNIDQIKKIKWLGYGNLDSTFWFIGIEEGAIWDRVKNPVQDKNFYLVPGC